MIIFVKKKNYFEKLVKKWAVDIMCLLSIKTPFETNELPLVKIRTCQGNSPNLAWNNKYS